MPREDSDLLISNAFGCLSSLPPLSEEGARAQKHEANAGIACFRSIVLAGIK